MSDHSIVYDLQYPGNGTLECHAAPDAVCRAVWNCDCETIHDFHVVDGQPHHFSTWESFWEDDQVRGHHVGKFDPDECHLRVWHEESEESVTGTVRVTVEPEWHGDYYTFKAVTAELANPTTRSPEGATS